MPSYFCKHPTCNALLKLPGYCDKHPQPNRHRFYDKHQRDQEAKQFYNSSAWNKIRNQVLTDQPWCANCKRKFATEVHHIVPARASHALRLERSNLAPLCHECHSSITARGQRCD